LFVALAFYGDPIFGSGQLIGQADELLVALQVGYCSCRRKEEWDEGDVELGIGIDVAGVIASSGEDSGAGVGDVVRMVRLFGDVTFYRSNKIRNQVETRCCTTFTWEKA